MLLQGRSLSKVVGVVLSGAVGTPPWLEVRGVPYALPYVLDES